MAEPSVVGVDAVVVVAGIAAADGLHAALDAQLSTVLDRPRPCAKGWWALGGSWSPGLMGVAAGFLAEHGAVALMVAGDAAEPCEVMVFEPPGDPVHLFYGLPQPEPTGLRLIEHDPSFAAWVRSHAPRRARPATLTALWERMRDESGRDVAVELLTTLGWQVDRFDTTSLLEGLTGGPEHLRQFIGETRVDWEKVRWIVGVGADFHGMWDLERPGAPVKTVPRTPAGMTELLNELYELVAVPILEATALAGERRWARLDPPLKSASTAFFHFSPERRLSMVWASRERPITYQLTEPGLARFVDPRVAERMGLEQENPYALMDIALTDLSLAQALATAWANGRVSGDDGPNPWMDIPDHVGRHFLDTWAWVRDQASN